ncbi:MAG TPA: riboflavin synthase [Nitrososphaeraceae archaeon]|nr:riboflavin synthase [Nitrososphaeraceae archaeon]
MFTGIVEALCKVKSAKEIKKETTKYPAEIALSIDLGKLSKGLKNGQSVAVNGVCLTIIKLHGCVAEFSLIGETIRKTSLGSTKKGDRVNIERSMKASGRFDGHFVQGHVDCTAIIYNKIIYPNETKLFIKISETQNQLSRYILQKGSITIDGISLTVVDIRKNLLSVSLIPHTLEKTTLGRKSIGDIVNIEFDIVGKYISKLLPKK